MGVEQRRDVVGILEQDLENRLASGERKAAPLLEQKAHRQRRQVEQGSHGGVLDFIRLEGREEVRQNPLRRLSGIQSQDSGGMDLQLGGGRLAKCFEGSAPNSSETPSVVEGDPRPNSQRRRVDPGVAVFDQLQQHLLSRGGKTDSPFRPALQALGQAFQNHRSHRLTFPCHSPASDLQAPDQLLGPLPGSNHPCDSLQALESVILSLGVLDPGLHGFQPAHGIAADRGQHGRLKPGAVHMPKGNGTQCFEGRTRRDVSQ